jgi:hypothetical protein
MKKIISLSLVLVVLLCGCSQNNSTTKVANITTTSATIVTTNTNSVNTGTNSFSVDTKLDFGQTIPVNSIYSKQVIVNINNTGDNTITRVSLKTDGLDPNWICVGSADMLLKSGEAIPFVITLSSKNPITSGMTLSFTITLTATAYVDVQYTLECYGEIIVK